MSKIMKISCLLLLISAIAFDTATAQPSAEEIFYAAEADWQMQRWDESLSKYQQVTTMGSPYAAQAHIQVGKYYKYRKSCYLAIQEFEMAIAKAIAVREAEDAQSSIGAVYICMGDYPKAVDVFKNLLVGTRDWQQVKYCTYWIKELKRRMAFKDYAFRDYCGYKALKEMFRLKGIKFIDRDFDMAAVPKGGSSMADLEQLAASKGLKLYGAALSPAQLHEIAKPVIALLAKPAHYVVITASDNHYVSVVDPDHGRVPRRIPKKAFATMWQGKVLACRETQSTMALSLLSSEEMQQLKGGVCYCCRTNNHGTQGPHTENQITCVNPTLAANTVNLNLAVMDTDLSYRTRGPDIVFTRAYNGDDPDDGPFGPSWTFSYNVSVLVKGDDSIDWRRESGTIHNFTDAGGGNYHPPLGVYHTLVKNGDNTYTVTLKGSKTQQNFNAQGKLTSIFDRNGNTVTMGYDAYDRLSTITDAVGRVTTITYNAEDKISAVTDPRQRTVTYSYDENNNLTAVTNAAGETVTYTYEEFRYMTSITTSKGTAIIDYDKTSSEGYYLKSITDALGKVTYYGTYSSDYNIRITDANDNNTDYGNNYDGFTDKITDDLGNIVIFGYDNGNRTSIEDARGNTSSLSYDSRGNLTAISDPLDNSASFTYDDDDNLTQLVDPLNKTYTYEYDQHHNLSKIIDPENGETTFTYNEYGELTALTDARNHSYTFSYDSQGNLVGVTDPLGYNHYYAYDEIGRVEEHTDSRGITMHYSYDNLDRLSKIMYPDGSVKRFSYDCCGLKTISGRNGDINVSYDAANRITAITDVYGKTISHGYDDVGNLTTLTYPDGKMVSYEYDDDNRLNKVTDWLGNATTYEYDAASNLVTTTYPEGSVIIHKYDKANRLLSSVDCKANVRVNGAFFYTLDAASNRTGIDFDQPLKVTPTIDDDTYTHASDNRLLTAANASFEYDNNGNLLRKTVDTVISEYSWNYDNMLTQIVSGDNTRQYQYDPLGNRIAKVENGSETRYVVHPTGLPSILAETSSNGNITAYYVYGLGLISKITLEGEAYYYHYDGIGSTIAITNATGDIVNKYAYDAFGKVIGSEEGIDNAFKYVGRFGVMDEGNGLLYMRARYYDCEMRRFIKKDPIGFAGGINLYGYVGNNPRTYTDPSGLCTLHIQSILIDDNPITWSKRLKAAFQTLLGVFVAPDATLLTLKLTKGDGYAIAGGATLTGTMLLGGAAIINPFSLLITGPALLMGGTGTFLLIKESYKWNLQNLK